LHGDGRGTADREKINSANLSLSPMQNDSMRLLQEGVFLQ
jgi:hypothetical protein